MIHNLKLLFIPSLLLGAILYGSENPHKITFDQIVENSKKFDLGVCPFPTSSNRITNIARNNDEIKPRIAKHAQETKIIFNKKIIPLLENFLTCKRKFGSPKEQVFYASLTVPQLIIRLIEKRPLTFFYPMDKHLLRAEPRTVDSPFFNQIGKLNESDLLKLEDYISYDEMPLAGLLGVSSPTSFINNGGRSNEGKKSPQEGSYEKEGVYVGLVGCRFEKKDLMECAHMRIKKEDDGNPNDANKEQDVCRQELMKIWAKFYGHESNFPSFQDVDNADNTDYPVISLPPVEDTYGATHYHTTPDHFNIPVYKKRMSLVILPFLKDAVARAKKETMRPGDRHDCHPFHPDCLGPG